MTLHALASLPEWSFSAKILVILGAEIGQYRTAGGDERGGEALAGEADHLVVVGAGFFHVAQLVADAARVEPLLGADAPRAPDFDVELQRHGARKLAGALGCVKRRVAQA